MVDHIYNPAAVSRFIVIPANDLHHFADNRSHLRIKRTGVTTIVYIHRNYGVFRIKQDVFQLITGYLFKSIIYFLNTGFPFYVKRNICKRPVGDGNPNPATSDCMGELRENPG